MRYTTEQIDETFLDMENQINTVFADINARLATLEEKVASLLNDRTDARLAVFRLHKHDAALKSKSITCEITELDE